jgi:hypothetical protein
MVPKSSPSFLANTDAELEWLFCLAAALQARQIQPAKLAAECRPSPEPTLRRRLQALLKRGTQRIPAA